MKHFEDLWNQSEELSSFFLSKEEAILNLNNLCTLQNLSDLNSEKLSQILFNLTALSYYYNINVFKILHQKIEEMKIMKMEKEFNFEQREFDINGKFKINLPEIKKNES